VVEPFTKDKEREFLARNCEVKTGEFSTINLHEMETVAEEDTELGIY
jgi:hypothetical protein